LSHTCLSTPSHSRDQCPGMWSLYMQSSKKMMKQ
jgi:hypothetical protein